MKPNRFSLGDLDEESFPALDPTTNRVRYFKKKDNFDLALSGKHKSYQGIYFKKLSQDQIDRLKNKHNNNKKTSSERKKYIISKFVILMRQYLKLSLEKRSQIYYSIIKKFKLSKTEESNKLFVYGSHASFSKYIGISESDIIKSLEIGNIKIPVKITK